MAYGAGKYDALCTEVREKAGAQAAIIIVLNGDRGSGFSVQAEQGVADILVLSDLLELVARQIRESGN